MQYITTKEHPELNAGIKVVKTGPDYQFTLGHKIFFAGQKTIDSWVNYGYIKEAEEKEFTKSDMMSFMIYYYGDDMWKESIKANFDNWLKQRNKYHALHLRNNGNVWS